jgi:hypothetical protein
MTEYLPSYMNHVVINDSKLESDGVITGGFPMSAILEQENRTNEMLGGGKRVSVDRFKDLAIPFSLDTHYDNRVIQSVAEIKGGSKNRKKETIDIMDGGLFDKLLDSIVLAKRNQNKNTRKQKEQEQKDVAQTKTTRKIKFK